MLVLTKLSKPKTWHWCHLKAMKHSFKTSPITSLWLVWLHQYKQRGCQNFLKLIIYLILESASMLVLAKLSKPKTWHWCHLKAMKHSFKTSPITSLWLVWLHQYKQRGCQNFLKLIIYLILESASMLVLAKISKPKTWHWCHLKAMKHSFKMSPDTSLWLVWLHQYKQRGCQNFLKLKIYSILESAAMPVLQKISKPKTWHWCHMKAMKHCFKMTPVTSLWLVWLHQYKQRGCQNFLKLKIY